MLPKKQRGASKAPYKMSSMIRALDLSTDNRLSFPDFTAGPRPSFGDFGGASEQQVDCINSVRIAQGGSTLGNPDQLLDAETPLENIGNDSDDSLVDEQAYMDSRKLRYVHRWRTMPTDENLQRRRKRARPWLLRSACLEVLTEDRLRAIEHILQSKGFMELENDKEDENAGKEKALLERGALYSGKMGWDEFTSLNDPKPVASRFAVLLVERPVPETLGSRRVGKRARRPAMSVQTLEGTPQVERIRFTAVEASHVLQEVMTSPPPAHNEAVIRPFKPLFAYYEELRHWFEGRRDGLRADKHDASGRPAGHVEEAKPDPQRSTPQEPDSNFENDPGNATLEVDAAHDLNKTIMAEAILDMMNTELKESMKLHLYCRHRRREWMQFDDLWHVFFPGDLVYDPRLDQALRVLCVQNGRTILDPFSEVLDKKTEEAPKMLGSKNAFAILTFSVDCDGHFFGPVQHLYKIDAWDGERRMTSLPIYPLEYADAAANEGDTESMTLPNAKAAFLRSRGRKFCEIANTQQLAHRDYRGFGLGKIREEVNNQLPGHRIA